MDEWSSKILFPFLIRLKYFLFIKKLWMKLTNGLGKSIKKYITDNGNVLTSDMIGSMANLACGLDNATIDTLTESDFT